MKRKFLIVLFSLFLSLTLTPLVLAEENVTNTPPATNQTQFDPVCIQNAIEKREGAIIAAYEKKSNAIKTALEQRKNALKEAWTKTTIRERVQARHQAWKNFRQARWTAQKTYHTEVKNAWKT
ncbi:MAG: hypothetical protein N2259_02090, partial [Patescibacteria group bacterium]|nr:hypothetical protein [Patescibacteria group bacterium]